MIYKSLTFVGSFVSALIWATLFRAIDVSSPQEAVSAINAMAFAVLVASFFLFADILISEKSPTTYFRMAGRALVVSIGGAAVILFGLFFIGISLGYIESQNIFLELTAVFLLGTLLVLSNFFSVLALKTVGYLLGARNDPHLR